jgi:hypothetical protein
MKISPVSFARRRQGISLLVLVLSLVLLAVVLGMTGAQRSQTSTNWLKHMRLDLSQQDLLDSMVEEAENEFLRATNDPSRPLFQQLREALTQEVIFLPELRQCRKIASELGTVGSLEAKIFLTDLEASGFEPESEWNGTMVVEVRLLPSQGSSRTGFLVRQSRSIRTTSVSAPRPLDRYCYFDYNEPASGQIQNSFEISRDYWSQKATLRISSGSRGIQAAYQDLRGRLPILNGVIYVANDSNDPLQLKDIRHQGRTILVTEGPVELVNVRLEDSSQDQLTILAFGDISVEGDLEASLILTHSPGDPEARRRVHVGTDIVGAFVLTQGTYQATRGFNLDCRPSVSSQGEGPISPGHLYVSVSPVVREHKLFRGNVSD